MTVVAEEEVAEEEPQARELAPSNQTAEELAAGAERAPIAVEQLIKLPGLGDLPVSQEPPSPRVVLPLPVAAEASPASPAYTTGQLTSSRRA